MEQQRIATAASLSLSPLLTYIHITPYTLEIVHGVEKIHKKFRPWQNFAYEHIVQTRAEQTPSFPSQLQTLGQEF